ncbi:hypothetical protein V8G54_025134 [Vigna mungo]|uniref:Uncharacterized protein n=1 Tax=Vigna mungo TaxID=3915 RepID=A0AAQ3N6X0_VIGMU
MLDKSLLLVWFFNSLEINEFTYILRCAAHDHLGGAGTFGLIDKDCHALKFCQCFQIFEKSLQCTFSTVEERASDYLSPHLKNTEGLLHLYMYWARLETKLGKDVTAARGVWENCLKICGSMLQSWTGYIAMEVELGHINEARSIYKRCYSKRLSGTGSEVQ